MQGFAKFKTDIDSTLSNKSPIVSKNKTVAKIIENYFFVFITGELALCLDLSYALFNLIGDKNEK